MTQDGLLDLISEMEYEFEVEIQLNLPFLEVDVTNVAPFCSNREELIEDLAHEMGHRLQEELNTHLWMTISTDWIEFEGVEVE